MQGEKIKRLIIIRNIIWNKKYITQVRRHHQVQQMNISYCIDNEKSTSG
jgi:hypothetical protein